MSHVDIGSDEHAPWSWATSLKALDEAVSKLEKSDDFATSRIISRTRLIKFDKQVAAGCEQIDAGPGTQDLQMLQTLLRHAENNDDHQLQHGIQWRIDVLVHNKQPEEIATPVGLVPLKIYQLFWTAVNHPVRVPVRSKWQDIRKTASEWWSSPQVLQAFHAPRASILLVGHTGTGKSTLFRAITRKYAATANGSRSTTKAIQTGTCQWNDGTMVECIDTPGFGDDNLSDYEGLEKLAEFLERRHRSRAVLTSVFYLISIKNNKIDGSALRQAEALKALIGDAAWSNTIFIFTHASAANMVSGPLRRQAEVDERKLKLRWETEIFLEAKEKGAQFKELGLDLSDVKEMDLAERANPRASAEDDNSDLEKQGGDSSDDDYETDGEPEAADDRDTSASRSSVFRSVQYNKGVFKVYRRMFAAD
jgi:GTP-binding protein EngB required for normal cell division